MKIAIYSRPEIGRGELAGFLAELDRHGVAYSVNDAVPPADIDMMIGYGGDGTFLDTVRRLDGRPVPVLGINAGRLGFLANVSKEEIAEAVADIAAGRYGIQERMLLHAAGDFGAAVDYPYAFNEFSVQKNGVAMVSIEVFIDGEPVTAFQGDGLIVSTPTGSTAYALSVGGPILAPDCRAMILVPLASHNLTLRPLVVPAESEIRVRVASRTGDAFATLDSRDYHVRSGSVFTIKKAEKTACLVKLHTNSFYRTLRDKMMWGVDSRRIVK